MDVTLSICIATYNRAGFIGDTLKSVLSQLTPECEVVISDNASTDNTADVVAEHTRGLPNVRYARHPVNLGLDRNFDHAVEIARGKYCWLLPDDDVLKPGAIAAVLAAARRDFSLILVNVETVNFDLSRVLRNKWLNVDAERVYEPSELDQLFIDLQPTIRYIGNIIIRRDVWMNRDRARYYDSLFIHVGMIYQRPLPAQALVMPESLVSYRQDNAHSFSAISSEIMLQKWPSLLESLALSNATLKQVQSAKPWQDPHWLLLLRAWGWYSLTEYRNWIRPRLASGMEKLLPVLIALLPGVLLNTVMLTYYSARRDRGHWVRGMKQSRFYLGRWRPFRHAQ